MKICITCGTLDHGNFCSHCGTELPNHKEDAHISATRALWDDFAGLLGDVFMPVLAALKALWLISWYPTRFFRNLFEPHEPMHNLPFPLAPLWSRLSDQPHYVLAPTPYYLLASAVIYLLFETDTPIFPEGSFSESLTDVINESIKLAFFLAGLFTIAVMSMIFRLILGKEGRTILSAKRAYQLWLYTYASSTFAAGFALYVFTRLSETESSWANLSAVIFVLFIPHFIYLNGVFPWLILPRILPGISRLRALGATLAVLASYVPVLYFFLLFFFMLIYIVTNQFVLTLLILGGVAYLLYHAFREWRVRKNLLN